MTELVIRKQSYQAQYFPEDLGNNIHLDMILVPEGTFLMGSPADELERSDSEGPQHSVRIPKFFMGRYPVTQEQWRIVSNYPRIDRDLAPDPSHFKGDLHPVESVSWYDAVEFCDRLKQHTGRPYRLPSESEWEYACRAATTTAFYFGKTLSPELSNYASESAYADGPTGTSPGETTPVNHYGVANTFGLSDMHGNVWEWCQDHWHGNYAGAPTDGSAWLMDNESAARLRRGGSWIGDPWYCRSACRFNLNPDAQDDYLGFRVAFSAPRTL